MQRDLPLTLQSAAGTEAGTRIVRAEGPLTLQNVFGFQDTMRADGAAPTTILDLSGVPYIDSAGMGAVINFYTHAQNRGGRLIVSGVNPRVFELFRITRMDRVLTIVGTVEEAESLH